MNRQALSDISRKKRIYQMFVFPAGDATFLAGRALRFQGAILTIILPITAMHQTAVAIGQCLSCRAGVNICLGVVEEVRLYEHALLAVA